jgi:hypothetical protein
MQSIIENHQIDAALCDFGSISTGCYESAVAKKRAYITTMVFAVSSGIIL